MGMVTRYVEVTLPSISVIRDTSTVMMQITVTLSLVCFNRNSTMMSNSPASDMTEKYGREKKMMNIRSLVFPRPELI